MIETQQKFSTKSVKKAVLNESLQSPVAVYPAVLGALGLVGIAAFGLSTVAIAIGAGGIGLAMGGWLFEYFGRHKKYSMLYLEKLHRQMLQQRVDKLRQIESDLHSIKANEALQQLKLFSAKFDNFTAILAKKFDPGELTYARYLGIAEQVFLAGLDNLENYYLTIKSVSAVDLRSLTARLDQLNGQADQAKHEGEITALTKRLDLYHQQQHKVHQIQQQNETALTELDFVTTKLADVQTKKGMADLDMENAMQELARMASRAEQYRQN